MIAVHLQLGFAVCIGRHAFFDKVQTIQTVLTNNATNDGSKVLSH